MRITDRLRQQIRVAAGTKYENPRVHLSTGWISGRVKVSLYAKGGRVTTCAGETPVEALNNLLGNVTWLVR